MMQLLLLLLIYKSQKLIGAQLQVGLVGISARAAEGALADS